MAHYGNADPMVALISQLHSSNTLQSCCSGPKATASQVLSFKASTLGLVLLCVSINVSVFLIQTKMWYHTAPHLQGPMLYLRLMYLSSKMDTWQSAIRCAPLCLPGKVNYERIELMMLLNRCCMYAVLGVLRSRHMAACPHLSFTAVQNGICCCAFGKEALIVTSGTQQH